MLVHHQIIEGGKIVQERETLINKDHIVYLETTILDLYWVFMTGGRAIRVKEKDAMKLAGFTVK